MARPNRRINEILRHIPAVAEALDRYLINQTAAQAIQPICGQLIPGLDVTQPGVCDLKAGSLRLTCTTVAQSNKLKQATPRLLMELQKKGLDVNEIRLRVQPVTVPERRVSPLEASSGTEPARAANVGKKAASYGNSEKLASFSRKTADSVGPGVLKDALLRLENSANRRLKP